MSRSILSSTSRHSRHSRRSAFDQMYDDDECSAMSGQMSSMSSPSVFSSASSALPSASSVVNGGGGDSDAKRKRRGSALALASLLGAFAVFAFSGVQIGGGGAALTDAVKRSLRKASLTPFVPPTGVGSDTTFLLGIFSTRTEKEAKRRQLIRDTYLTHGRDPRICYLSLYAQLPPSERAKCSVVYTFVVGGNDDGPTNHVDDNVKMTVGRHKVDGGAEEDVTYLNIRENIEDGKSDTWFKYGSHLSSKYGFDYVGKTDSDTYLNVDSLIEFVNTELPSAPGNVHVYGGIPWANYRKGGLYMVGQFYFMSADLAHYVGYELSPEQRDSMREEERAEDADMGNFVFSSPYPIKILICSTHLFWHHPVETDEDWHKFGARYGVNGGPVRRQIVMPWDDLTKIWLRQGVVKPNEPPPAEPQAQAREQ